MRAKRWSYASLLACSVICLSLAFAPPSRGAPAPFTDGALHHARLKALWQLPLGLGNHSRDRISHLWLVGKKLFALTHFGFLICVNASSGTIAWTQEYATRGQGTFEPVPYGKNQLLIVSGGKMLVVNAADGTVTKSQTLRFAPSTRPRIGSDRLFIGAFHDRLYSLSTHIPLFMQWAQYSRGDAFLSRPVVLDGMIVCGSQKGFLWGHIATDGSDGWRRILSGAVVANLGTDGKLVFVPCLNHNLYAVRPSSGIAPWITHLAGRLDHKPVMFAKHLLICTGDTGLFSLSPSTGQIQWGPAAGVERVVGKIANRIAAVTSAGRLEIISSADGTVIYHAKAKTKCLFAASTHSSTVYAASTRGYLMAIVRRYPQQ